jgi:hypothetical protein
MGWLTFGVCVLLGDGSGGVFFLVSSRSVILFGVRSEVVFSLGSVPRVYLFACHSPIRLHGTVIN